MLIVKEATFAIKTPVENDFINQIVTLSRKRNSFPTGLGAKIPIKKFLPWSILCQKLFYKPWKKKNYLDSFKG